MDHATVAQDRSIRFTLRCGRETLQRAFNRFERPRTTTPVVTGRWRWAMTMTWRRWCFIAFERLVGFDIRQGKGFEPFFSFSIQFLPPPGFNPLARFRKRTVIVPEMRRPMDPRPIVQNHAIDLAATSRGRSDDFAFNAGQILCLPSR